MNCRLLMATIIAIAILFAPLGVRSGMALAASPATADHAEMMTGGHCADQPAKEKSGDPDGKSCCAAMCTAIAASPPARAEPLGIASSRERPSPDLFRHGFLAELATPPPRAA